MRVISPKILRVRGDFVLTPSRIRWLTRLALRHSHSESTTRYIFKKRQTIKLRSGETVRGIGSLLQGDEGITSRPKEPAD